MAKDPAFLLKQRFLKYLEKHWKLNNHDLPRSSCVYVMVSYDFLNNKLGEIVYIGSTTNIRERYKSHNVPNKIQASGNSNLMYYVSMDYGFYDYEIKLIKKLKPEFNKQHKNGNR